MSLDGLTALIQLEGARLEGAQKTSQNSSQVGSQVLQQGLQTAEKKQNLVIQKINAEYERDCAAATVKRLECKLARERAAETLASSLAQMVLIGSGLSNLWDAGKDLFGGGQKLGEIPESLQVKPIDPNNPETRVSAFQSGDSNDRTVMVKGVDEDNRNVIKSFKLNEDGTASSFKSTTISDQDIKEFGGDEYQKMKQDNNGKDLSFSELWDKNPDLAASIANAKMEDSFSDMSRGEVDGLMNLVEGLKAKGATGNGDFLIKDKHIDAIKKGLIETGKATEHDFKDGWGKAWDVAVDGGDRIGGFMIQTAQDSFPYFHAYLKAREKADKTYRNKTDDGEPDLVGAIAKLNAANKKLNTLERDIDLFVKSQSKF